MARSNGGNGVERVHFLEKQLEQERMDAGRKMVGADFPHSALHLLVYLSMCAE